MPTSTPEMRGKERDESRIVGISYGVGEGKALYPHHEKRAEKQEHDDGDYICKSAVPNLRQGFIKERLAQLKQIP